MFRSLLLAAAIVAPLSACNVASSLPPVSSIQKEAVAICGYLPLASVIAAILSKHVPGLQSVFGVATQICMAVGPKPAGTHVALAQRRVPTVAGVPIHGRFVK